MRKIEKQSFEDYVLNYVDFFKDYKTADIQLKKLINTDLHCILNKYKKETKQDVVKQIVTEILNFCDEELDAVGKVRTDNLIEYLQTLKNSSSNSV